jgi:hypothetical protein
VKLPITSKLLLTFVVASPLTALAECSTGYCRGVGTEVVQTATVDSTGVYFMVPTGANIGCTLIEGIYMKLDRSNVAFRDIYATYLSAIAQGKYFQIGVDGSTSCTVAYIRLWSD